ncbi:tRNA (adenosine(37)-N6)-dimethylallyltransferase MiaA [Priestia flexa]|jgi:tRNA dimethylallyltransferase|uniref:tRNA dimethylallyltransferase n=1 Tax=Priestia flexa TaxID=86664 RepID=A0A8I1MBD5_9BACI|nr:tRNA (adenosine(37)-N6)-dimethylallyltransferase MiaA [Priestia flexa]MBN8249998.1 tRNA (adenosine(37)-N6)-dimethylallyltransferase MiaA [Priestia flexa]MBN8434679.1 tRNA (adenosine(37)-N6)-dimethylallyltransferase MiaA [Priestia flexa]MCA0967218.1 tRNA (adenosine(37)-N6)-dimethylallyltransferase MiaA [Priestia flexa]RIV15858.1 tRNA (adenosine(37)-N6)-dimethylallyltransferase MiaA [Priestia flexa]
MTGEKQKLIVIIGPTAVGKTKLSIEMAKLLNGEVISGDSMQIYKKMDIGTAKVTSDEMEGIPHHLIDIKEPTESFSVAEFQEIVREKITDIHGRGKLPIIVGGTGLYIQSVIYDYQFTESAGDEHFRQRMEHFVAAHGIEPLYQKLCEIDPVGAESIHPNNHRRVIRALEVYEVTGKPFSVYNQEQNQELLYDVTLIGLTMDRDQLYDRINQRVDMMVQEGLVEEVKSLYDAGVRDVQSIQAIGYKELYTYFDGNCTLEEAIEQLKLNSRRYAKRQLTWFRNKMPVTWFEMEVDNFHEKFNKIFTYVAGKLKEEAN